MDGLLLDTERCAWFVGERVIGKEYGVEVPMQLSTSLMGSDHQATISMIKNTFGQDFPAEEYLIKLTKYYENFCKTAEIPLRPFAKELLEFLKENNIYISLGTSTERKHAEVALKRAGLLGYFDYVVYGDQVKKGKPNPEIFLKSVEHFGLKPEECVVFEDSSIGARAAYDGNIKLILVPDLKEPTDLDKEKAFAIIRSLDSAIEIIKKENNIK